MPLARSHMTAVSDPFAHASDEDVLLAHASGDPRAAGALTQRVLPRVLAQALRMLANRAEAEDVAQDAMLQLWRIAPDWRRGEA